jgi:4-hydroxy-3-methylbut-2-enyl diphosphate reductase
VERAVETVELALEHYGAPVYVRHQIVHNAHVVRDLEARGAVFVETEAEAPLGATIVFSAHGVAPSVHERSAERKLNTIDATCPLVTKVHVQARRYAAEGYTVVLVGHAGHEEVVGTMGEAPDSIVLVESVEDVERLERSPDQKLAYITQTTLSVDETMEIIGALRRPLSGHSRPQEGRHLLRDVQPPVGRQGDDRAHRGAPRDRLEELVQLEPTGRGCACGRRACIPHRR